MNQRFLLTLKQVETPYPVNNYQLEVYKRDSGRIRRLEVDQRCADRINELIGGDWYVELKEGQIELTGSITR